MIWHERHVLTCHACWAVAMGFPSWPLLAYHCYRPGLIGLGELGTGARIAWEFWYDFGGAM